jgi:thiamine pyrophosphate-dependent acetolactate synthase large subunit-like protein
MRVYAVLIEDVNDVAYELEKAIHIATTGRPGPVWVDFPCATQAMINTYFHGTSPVITSEQIAYTGEKVQGFLSLYA